MQAGASGDDGVRQSKSDEIVTGLDVQNYRDGFRRKVMSCEVDIV